MARQVGLILICLSLMLLLPHVEVLVIETLQLSQLRQVVGEQTGKLGHQTPSVFSQGSEVCT